MPFVPSYRHTNSAINMLMALLIAIGAGAWLASGCPDCIPPITCTGSFWNAGYWPSLKLDALGNPRIAYEVQLWNGGGACSVSVLARVPRLAIFDQP